MIQLETTIFLIEEKLFLDAVLHTSWKAIQIIGGENQAGLLSYMEVEFRSDKRI